MAESRTKPASREKPRVITRDELPLYCPIDAKILWQQHPRVYLPIEETGREMCPYCGTVYILADEQKTTKSR